MGNERSKMNISAQLKEVAKTGVLPDGDHVLVCTKMWLEELVEGGQLDAILGLRKTLKEEYQWACGNQAEAIENDNEKEAAWNRGYRVALRQIAKKIGIKLETSK